MVPGMGAADDEVMFLGGVVVAGRLMRGRRLLVVGGCVLLDDDGIGVGIGIGIAPAHGGGG